MSDIIKYGDQVDIMQFLPPHLVNTTTGQFVKAIEDYVNQMYEYKKDDKSPNRINCTLTESEYKLRLSLLGKIKDLSNLHDAKKVDHELIGKIANLLGYDFGIATTEIMNMVAILSNGDGEDFLAEQNIETKLVEMLSPYDCGDDPVDKATEFVRQMLVELPYWYSIKGTGKLAKVFFWCFGLMMKWEYGWTKNYTNSTTDWKYSEEDNYENGYIPTTHVRASFGLDETFTGNENLISWLNTQGLSRIVETLSSIKPINVVIDEVVFFLTMPYTVKVNLSLGIDSYYYFKSKNISDDLVWDGGFGRVDPRSYMFTRPVTHYALRNPDYSSFLSGPVDTLVQGSDDGTGYNPLDVVFTFDIPNGEYASYEPPI